MGRSVELIASDGKRHVMPEPIAGLDYPISVNPFEEIPLYSFSGWRQPQVQAALDGFEVGAMIYPHQMFIAMLRDPVFSHGVEGRVTALVDADFEWRKPPDLPQAIFDEWVARWPDAFDENELASAVRLRIGLGLAPAQCIWTAAGTSYWLRRCHVFDTGNCTWFPMDRRYKIVLMLSGMQNIDDDCDPWVLFKDRAASYPHLYGAARSLAFDWWCKSEATRLESLYGRRCGNPIWKVIAPVEQRAPTDSRNDYQRLVKMAQTLLGNGVFEALKFPPDWEKGFDLEFLEAKGEAHKVFDMIIDRADTNMTLKLLGAIDNTQGGRDGSRARADVHQKQTSKYLGADGRLTERTLNRISRKWCELNRWPITWAPKAHFVTDPPEDQGALAEVRVKYADSLQRLATPGKDGAPSVLEALEAKLKGQDPTAAVDWKGLLEGAHIPLIEPGEQDPRTAPTDRTLYPDHAEDGLPAAEEARRLPSAEGGNGLLLPDDRPL